MLAGEEGTALSPLAEEAGTAVLLLGGILVVLGMGMASIHSSLALFYLVRERLPARAPLTLVLPRRGARVVLEARRRRRAHDDRADVRRPTSGGAARFRLDVAAGAGTRRGASRRRRRRAAESRGRRSTTSRCATSARAACG